MNSRDERLLFFGLPFLGGSLQPDDEIDLFEAYMSSSAGEARDLRAYLQPIKGDGFANGYNAKIYRRREDGDSFIGTPMRFDPGVPVHEMTQWLWMQCACFNEDTGKRDVEDPEVNPQISDTFVTDRCQSDTGELK